MPVQGSISHFREEALLKLHDESREDNDNPWFYSIEKAHSSLGSTCKHSDTARSSLALLTRMDGATSERGASRNNPLSLESYLFITLSRSLYRDPKIEFQNSISHDNRESIRNEPCFELDRFIIWNIKTWKWPKSSLLGSLNIDNSIETKEGGSHLERIQR